MNYQTNNYGSLYLIPSLISDSGSEVLAPEIKITCSFIDHYLVENIRTARRFLSKLNLEKSISSINFNILDKNTTEETIESLMSPIFIGHHIGIISEAGCPGIADPGALAVFFAHRHGIRVNPLTGPSSILLALMSSGLSGQSFCFHGYLPIEKQSRSKSLIRLEQESGANGTTQIFMETPYRNQKLYDAILNICQPSTLLCIARDIQGPEQLINTFPISKWRTTKLDLHKKPTIFLLASYKP